MDMTDKRLADIEARAEAATPGPWRASTGRTYDPSTGRVTSVEHWISRGDDDVGITGDVSDSRTGTPSEPTALFIAHARTDVPDLIAEVRRLRAVIAGRTTPPTDAEIEAVSGETGDSDTPEALLEMARVEIGAAESVLKGTRLVRGDPSRHSAEDAEDLVGAIRLCIGVMEHAANAALAIRAEALDLTDSCGSEYRMRVENVAYEAATYASRASKEVWAAEAARAEGLEEARAEKMSEES